MHQQTVIGSTVDKVFFDLRFESRKKWGEKKKKKKRKMEKQTKMKEKTKKQTKNSFTFVWVKSIKLELHLDLVSLKHFK